MTWRSERRRAGLLVTLLGITACLVGYRAGMGTWLPRPASDEDRSSSEGTRPLTQREKIEQLEALGYVVTESQAPPGMGVTVHESDATFAGVNLYSSMHAPEILLLDMAGETLHRWVCAYEKVFPDDPAPERSTGPHYYRGVHLYPDGDLLVIFEGLGIARLDREGTPRWAVHNGAHHDVDVGPDGTIYVLTRRAHVVEAVHPTEPILEDGVDLLTADGRHLGEVSLLDAVRASPFSSLVSGQPATGDIFHANSVRVLSDRHVGLLPALARGHLLVSLRNRNAIVVVDPAKEAAVWAMRDVTFRQHDATLLDDGSLLVFDNRDRNAGSRAVELEPGTREVRWQYPAAGAPPLFSERFGVAQRLPNGNTLITFSELGSALEVTPEHRVVWRFDSPHRTGARDDFVVPLVDVQRHSHEYVASWLPRGR